MRKLLQGAGTIVPANEAQARPLSKLLKEPEILITAWGKAVERAGNQQPTAMQVKEAVDLICPRESPSTSAKAEAEAKASNQVPSSELQEKVDAAWLRLRSGFSDDEFETILPLLKGKIEAWESCESIIADASVVAGSDCD